MVDLETIPDIPRLLFTAKEVAISIGAGEDAVFQMQQLPNFPRINIPGEPAPRFELPAVLSFLRGYTADTQPGWGYARPAQQPAPEQPRIIPVRRRPDGLGRG